MKRIITILFSLFLCSIISAQTITFLTSDTKMLLSDANGNVSTKSFYYDYALPKLLKDFPNAKIELLQVDLKTGAALSLDSLLAAGTPPNIYSDTLVRSSKLMTPEYALPLNKYIRDIDKFKKNIISQYTHNGDILALPVPGSPQGFCINLDIMKEIGYTVPDKWTIADFLKMAELVKQKYNGKKFATGMFAANQSGDYLINTWFGAFGVKYYNTGDYSKTIIKETGGAKVYTFFQTLVKNGYVPAGAAMLNDDDYAAEWAKGNYAATAFYPGWHFYWDTAIQQKLITKPFAVKYVPFPRDVGVENTPSYLQNGAYVVHKTGTEKDKIAARLVEYLNDAYVHTQMSLTATLPVRTDVKPLLDSEYLRQIQKIFDDGGVLDVGLTCPKFPATRPTHFPILQKVLNLTITPDAAITEYENVLNDVLKD